MQKPLNASVYNLAVRGENLGISREELARLIDSTVVRATATKSEVENLCKEAVKYGFRCAVVNGVYVKFAA